MKKKRTTKTPEQICEKILSMIKAMFIVSPKKHFIIFSYKDSSGAFHIYKAGLSSDIAYACELMKYDTLKKEQETLTQKKV